MYFRNQRTDPRFLLVSHCQRGQFSHYKNATICRNFRSAGPADTFLDFSDPDRKIILGGEEEENSDDVIINSSSHNSRDHHHYHWPSEVVGEEEELLGKDDLTAGSDVSHADQLAGGDHSCDERRTGGASDDDSLRNDDALKE